MNTAGIVQLVNQIFADIDNGRITSVTEGFRADIAPLWSNQLRSYGYVEMADRLASL